MPPLHRMVGCRTLVQGLEREPPAKRKAKAKLKALPSLLGSRRSACVFSCAFSFALSGGRAPAQDWSASLYEARWKEVLVFVHMLLKEDAVEGQQVSRLSILCAAWDN